MNDADRTRLFARAAAMAEHNPRLTGWALSRYVEIMDIDHLQLAEELGCSMENLARLALCGRPTRDTATYTADIDRIAAHTGVDPYTLAEVFAAVENDTRLHRIRPAASPGMLMAARDRQPEDPSAEQSPANEESSAEQPSPSDAEPPQEPRP